MEALRLRPVARLEEGVEEADGAEDEDGGQQDAYLIRESCAHLPHFVFWFPADRGFAMHYPINTMTPGLTGSQSLMASSSSSISLPQYPAESASGLSVK